MAEDGRRENMEKIGDTFDARVGEVDESKEGD